MELLIEKYFPDLTETQKVQFAALPGLYQEWNARINVVSRKDLEHLEIRHILHSLSIGKAIRFKPGTRILDIGTGGGFPGIPLAILFPKATFVLVDSIRKKVQVVKEIAQALQLRNIEISWSRAETLTGTADFVTGRAVVRLPEFIRFSERHISKQSTNDLPNGILYLKGGDFPEELAGIRHPYTILSISDWFQEGFFETKKLIHIPII